MCVYVCTNILMRGSHTRGTPKTQHTYVYVYVYVYVFGYVTPYERVHTSTMTTYERAKDSDLNHGTIMVCAFMLFLVLLFLLSAQKMIIQVQQKFMEEPFKWRSSFAMCKAMFLTTMDLSMKSTSSSRSRLFHCSKGANKQGLPRGKESKSQCT